MKRIIVIAVLLLTSKQLLSQASGFSFGSGESAYKELAQAYSVQGKEMSKEEEEKILKNLSSEMKSKLEEIKKLNKNKYYQLLREVSYSAPYFMKNEGYFSRNNLAVAGFSADDAAAKEEFAQQKKEQELEIEMELLTLKCKSAEKADQQKMKADLTSVLNKLFDIRETQKQEEVKKLEKRLQELKESLQMRKQNKDEIVQRRIQELLGDSKYLRWE